MQTMQQKRAVDALRCAKDAANKAYRKEFKSCVQALPAMIHMNGLGQSVAFYKAKSNSDGDKAKAKAYENVYAVLSNWLKKDEQPYRGCTDLLEGVTSKDMHAYRLAEAEALAYLDWLKRFSEAFIEDSEPAGQPAQEADQEGGDSNHATAV